MSPLPSQFVSRGGLKLHHALTEFAIDATGLVCADLGCSTGGFTDCLLQAGAAKVHSVDTAYGELAWKLRNDPRVVVTERTNALHAVPPVDGVDLVVVDLGWTVQRLVVPAALKWLRHSGRIITLIKPHYEAREYGIQVPRKGVLSEEVALQINDKVLARMSTMGVTVRGVTKSPILGGKEKSTGNPEWLALLELSRPPAA